MLLCSCGLLVHGSGRCCALCCNIVTQLSLVVFRRSVAGFRAHKQFVHVHNAVAARCMGWCSLPYILFKVEKCAQGETFSGYCAWCCSFSYILSREGH